MNHRILIRPCWCALNILIAVSLLAVLFSAVWEYSTRCYLQGFSDAIIPFSDNPVQKIESILAWMQNGASRRSEPDLSLFAARDPEETLNYVQLLSVCGTATNAFVNLAESTGLRVRRLLLLNERQSTKHVVAEVLVDGRWIVVDPAYHLILRSPDSRMLTSIELAEPVLFRKVSELIPNYPPEYTYNNTVHVRLSRIPIVGHYLGGLLNKVYPSWDQSPRWTLLLERASLTFLTFSSVLLAVEIVARAVLSWYLFNSLGLRHLEFWGSNLKARRKFPSGGTILST